MPWVVGAFAASAFHLWFVQRPWWQRLAGWAVAAGWSWAVGRLRSDGPSQTGFPPPLTWIAALLAVSGAEGATWGSSPTGVVASILLSAGAAAIWVQVNVGTRLGQMRALAVTLATVLSLGATEAALRVLRIGAASREKGSRELARRFNTLTPPLSAYVNEPKVLDEFEPALVEINSVGIRGPEVPRGTTDLLLLGDSYVEARQVPWEQTVGARLRERLAREAPGARVVSHGMRGWAPLLEWNWFLKVGREFRPRVVLLFFFWNDLSSYSTEAKVFDAVLRPDGRPDYFNSQVDPWWLWYKPLRIVPVIDEVIRLTEANTLRRLVRGGMAGIGTARATRRLDLAAAQRLARQMADGPPFTQGEIEALLSRPMDQLDAGLRRAVRIAFWPGVRPMSLWWQDQRASAQSSEATLAAFRDDVAAEGGRLVIVYVPNPYQLAPSECSVGRLLDRLETDVVLPPDSGVQAWLRSFSVRYGVEVLDPSDAMREAAVARASRGEPPLYLRADCHWSTAGHQFIADWLAEWYLRR